MKATKNLNCDLLMRHRVIIGTCVALGQIMSLDLVRGHFSHIIVDEAGQSSEPEILIPLGKFIFCFAFLLKTAFLL